mmetsp:Transcript_27424/g.73786  ORF Transcript_27424/g.73786 Transcript_27424/m.73786 type:complete len:290 (+) Transcript_27424:305-1174(+)
MEAERTLLSLGEDVHLSVARHLLTDGVWLCLLNFALTCHALRSTPDDSVQKLRKANLDARRLCAKSHTAGREGGPLTLTTIRKCSSFQPGVRIQPETTLWLRHLHSAHSMESTTMVKRDYSTLCALIRAPSLEHINVLSFDLSYANKRGASDIARALKANLLPQLQYLDIMWVCRKKPSYETPSLLMQHFSLKGAAVMPVGEATVLGVLHVLKALKAIDTQSTTRVLLPMLKSLIVELDYRDGTASDPSAIADMDTAVTKLDAARTRQGILGHCLHVYPNHECKPRRLL